MAGTWQSVQICGLSVTPQGNLLAVCSEPNALVELKADSGHCLREIVLPSDMEGQWHSVQLTTGELVVSHGVPADWPGYTRGLNRVCVVGDDGKVTRGYGGYRGSDVGRLEAPCHLAVDEDSGMIYVADASNNRVVLLSLTLEFVRYVVEELSHPYRLHFHQATRRLFISHNRDDMHVTANGSMDISVIGCLGGSVG